MFNCPKCNKPTRVQVTEHRWEPLEILRRYYCRCGVRFVTREYVFAYPKYARKESDAATTTR